ncbi:poly(A) polymerase [Streptomyces sp. NPDC089919]|uniref:poly(A) polymerase n=1 Tax=Streptomyces sp. NPDC089919 TaxID=3155188 RepID=UPI00342C9A02
MRTSEEIYHQVRWDPRLDPARFVLGLLQRGAPPKRVPLPAFVPGGDIPWHRVLFMEADGELVWDRAAGLDRVGQGDAGRVRADRLLRSPYFATRTPHSWDGAGWSAAEPVPATAPSRVRVLTWNTLWDRYDPELIDTARRRPLLLAALAAADADVIALQEVEPALVEMLLAADWVRAGYTLGTDPHGPDPAQHGLLLLSRLPVREAGCHELGRHKALTAVVVETAAGPLTVAAVHLSSDHSANSAARRTAELAQVAEGLALLPGEVALVGDFNDGHVGARGPEGVLGLRDAWTEQRGPADDTPTFDPAANPLAALASLTGQAGRIDRVLLRGTARPVECALTGDRPSPDGLFVSDHYGLRADLDFATAGGEGREPALATLAGAPSVRTALAWLPPAGLVPPLRELRTAHDPQVRRWPEHVNLLHGFAPEHDFDRAAGLVSEVAAGTPAFPVRLSGVHTFGHREEATVWLDPAADGDGAWQELHAALTARFPGCWGRCGGFTPHLTLGRSRDPRRVAAACAEHLAGRPDRARVGELALLSRRGEEPMRVRATVELGTGTVRWLPEEVAGDGPADPPGEITASPPGAPDTAELTHRVAAALPGALVETVGSRRLGCALPGADLDLVAAVPGTVDPGAVADRLRAALPAAARLREVTGARVPGLRFALGDLDVDLVLVGTGPLDPARAVARRAELGEAAAVALSAVADADAVAAAVGARGAAFGRLARTVKGWARARGLDCAPYGGLPGIAWAVLAARTVRAAGPDASDAELLRGFFATWAAWDWREPVALADPPAGPAPGGDPVTVLTPAAPVRSCTAQVSAGFRDLLVAELYRAWEALEAGDPGALTEPPPLHRRHAAWALVSVRASGPEAFEELRGRVRGRLRALVRALEEAGAPDAHAWPVPVRDRPDAVRLAIGLGRTPPDADRLAAVAAAWCRDLPGVTVSRAEGGALGNFRRP